MTSMIPAPVELPDMLREFSAHHGDAYGNYRPACALPNNAVGLVVGDQKVVCSREQAVDALRVLVELFGPLAESRRVAQRVARLGENGGGQDA